MPSIWRRFSRHFGERMTEAQWDAVRAIAILAVLAIAGAAGTRGSRWYVTPFFTTCLVLVMLLDADPTVANEQWRFAETVLGVGLAYFFGLLLPRLLRRRTAWRM